MLDAMRKCKIKKVKLLGRRAKIPAQNVWQTLISLKDVTIENDKKAYKSYPKWLNEALS